MAYITQTDIENIFGISNVRKWSQLDNDQAASDNPRIARAIVVADSEIDDIFRVTQYTVPLTAVSGTLELVKDWAAKLAGVWIYECRGLQDDDEEGNKLTKIKEAVHSQMNDYVAGKRTLNAVLKNTSPSAPVVV